MTTFEYQNICPHCGRENSLFPYFMGKKRGYRCDPDLSGGCGVMTKGITKSEAVKRGLTIKPEVKRFTVILCRTCAEWGGCKLDKKGTATKCRKFWEHRPTSDFLK